MFKPTISPRAAILLCLIVMHASLAAAIAFVFGAIGAPDWQPQRWPELALVMGLIVWAQEGLGSRAGQWRRGVAPLAGLLLLLLGLKSILGGGSNPFGGWSVLAPDGLRAQEVLFSTAALAFVLIRALRIGFWGGAEIAGFLQRGLLAFILCFTLGSLLAEIDYDQPAYAGRLTLFVVAFIASGLTALATEQTINDNADRQAPPTLLRTLGLVGASSVAAFLAFALFSETGRRLLAWAIGGVANLFAALFGLVALAIAFLIGPLTSASGGQTQPPQPIQTQQPIQTLPTIVPTDAAPVAGQIDWGGLAVQALTWLVIAAAVWFGLRGLGRVWQRWRRSAGPDEERTSVWAWDDARRDLRDLLGTLRPKRRGDDPLHGASPILRVRRAYRQFLAFGDQAGAARRSDQTPREYAAEAAPEANQAAIAGLTAAYESARYGHSASEEDAAAAEARLSDIIKRG